MIFRLFFCIIVLVYHIIMSFNSTKRRVTYQIQFTVQYDYSKLDGAEHSSLQREFVKDEFH